jgi:acyl-coenzyme A thioesterase PaaI-like protein
MLLKETALVRLLGLFRIPSLLFVSPRVISLDDEGCAVEIPFGWRSRNHVGSMYLGVLCAGADLASGLNAARLIYGRHRKVKLVFASLEAEFLKRADGDVRFTSRDGRRVAEAVRQADETGERVTIPIEVVATVPRKYADEPVARFTMGLSLKRKDAAADPLVASGERRAAAAGGTFTRSPRA